ncbi:MAG: hypothetical protein WCT53_05995 [Candidatus Gracilibacteria bacterium]|jgi:hypothetical protein
MNNTNLNEDKKVSIFSLSNPQIFFVAFPFLLCAVLIFLMMLSDSEQSITYVYPNIDTITGPLFLFFFFVAVPFTGILNLLGLTECSSGGLFAISFCGPGELGFLLVSLIYVFVFYVIAITHNIFKKIG